MSRCYLDDDKLAKLYKDGVRMSDIEKRFGVHHRTVYTHLAWQGITPNRKVSKLWTPHEEAQLIDAVRNNATGFEYEFYVPTRTATACKGHRRYYGT